MPKYQKWFKPYFKMFKTLLTLGPNILTYLNMSPKCSKHILAWGKAFWFRGLTWGQNTLIFNYVLASMAQGYFKFGSRTFG